MNPALLAIGHARMESAHHLILLAGALGVLSVFAGHASRRLGAPVLLVFIGVGMLASDDGIGGIVFNDFNTAYLIGSVALALILFEGGLKTPPAKLRLAFWPALVLATIGVALTAGIFAVVVDAIIPGPLSYALLVGAVVAPTDAAAVNTLLRRAAIVLPERVTALLEVESGLNDPMSIFLTVMMLRVIADPSWVTPLHAIGLFAAAMLGGVAMGMAGGGLLVLALRRVRLEASIATVLVLTAGLALFGLAQMVGASGFLAVYLAAIMVGAARFPARADIGHFFEGMAQLAQVVLFLMLGLLVTPRLLPPMIVPGVVGAATLMFIARPAATVLCLAPFGFDRREIAFSAWVGLRGAVPIYLSILPALADPHLDARLFGVVFVLVIASLIVQGWTIGPAGRLLGYAGAAAGPAG